MARTETACEVLHQDFLALDLPPARFDGIFANASLFHVPSSQLARVLRDFAATLRPSGVLFCSNPRGRNEEGWAGGRYGCFHDLETWRTYVTAVGFRELRDKLARAVQPDRLVAECGDPSRRSFPWRWCRVRYANRSHRRRPSRSRFAMAIG